MFGLPFEKLIEIAKYTLQKCKALGKDDSYLPTLLENEIEDYKMRQSINDIWRFDYENSGAETRPA